MRSQRREFFRKHPSYMWNHFVALVSQCLTGDVRRLQRGQKSFRSNERKGVAMKSCALSSSRCRVRVHIPAKMVLKQRASWPLSWF